MSTNHNSLLSDNKNKNTLTWTTKGKTSSDGETLVKTEGIVNITIPDKPELKDDTRIGSANQISPMSIASQTFDSNNSIYTIQYKWKHNMGTSGYIDGSLKVVKSDDNTFSLTGGSKNINVSGLTHHSRSDLRTARLFKVGASVTIPSNTDNNDIGGSVTDDKFYEIPNSWKILGFGGRTRYISESGPAQCAANPDDIIGILEFASDDSWIHINPNTIQLTADGWSATPSIDIDSNAPTNAKYGTVDGDLSIANIVTMPNTGGSLSLVLSGLTKTSDADNSSSITNDRSGNITYTFSVENYIKNTPDGNTLNGVEDGTGLLSINQLGGQATVPNPEITYNLTYVSADYTINGDNFTPSGSNPYSIEFGDISGEESVVSGGINADFPSSFNSWGGTISGVDVTGIRATTPVNYSPRTVKLNATATAKYVGSVNNSTDGIDENHTYTQTKVVTIPQNGSNWPDGEATIQFYVDSCSSNGTPNGKSKPTITLGTPVMSFNNGTTNTTSITASSNESNTSSGGVSGTLNTSISSTSIPASGGTVTITGTPNMTFEDAKAPATNSAFFRICGYMTSITGEDYVNSVNLDDFGKTWTKGNTTPPTGSKLVYCGEVAIAGKDEVTGGTASTTATLSVNGGSLNTNSWTFSDNTEQRSNWRIYDAGKPTGRFSSVTMNSDITSLTVQTSGRDVYSRTFECEINDSDVTVNPSKLSVTRAGLTQYFRLNLNPSGNTEYLEDFKYNNSIILNVYSTYTFTGWKFGIEDYDSNTSYLYFTEQGASNKIESYPFTADGGTKIFDIKQFFTEDTTTGRKKVTFNFTGEHEYGDGNWRTEETRSWTKTIDRTFTNPSFTLIKANDGLSPSIFTYTLEGNTLTTWFNSSGGSTSSSSVTAQPWNTNGFTNYFKATFSPGGTPDPARSTSITIASTDKKQDGTPKAQATLTLTRAQGSGDSTSTFTPTFSSVVSNNVISLTYDPNPATLNASNTTLNIYPKCTYDADTLNTWDISVFTPQSTNNNITASITLPIDTRDSSGNYQLGAFDGGNYQPTLTVNGIPLDNGNIIGNFAVNGTITCDQQNSNGTHASSTYSGTLTRAFSTSSIMNGSGSWSLDNTYGGFITWNANYVYIDESMFDDNTIPEDGVNVTLTYTMKLNSFGTALNNGNSTVTASTIIHIDGKHYVNIPWSDQSDQGTSTETDYSKYVVVATNPTGANEYYIKNNADIPLKVTYKTLEWNGNEYINSAQDIITLNPNSKYNTGIDFRFVGITPETSKVYKKIEIVKVEKA